MSFTIQQVLIFVDNGYETVDVQIESDRIAAIAPQLPASGVVIRLLAEVGRSCG